MVKHILFLSVFLLSLISCDKQRRTTKKIDGEWEISVYKITDTEGLAEYAVCSGSYVFTSCINKSIACDYTCNLTFNFPSNTGISIETGTFEILPDGEFMDVTCLNSLNEIISIYNYRILTLTKTDLQLEYRDLNSKLHSLIFKKKK